MIVPFSQTEVEAQDTWRIRPLPVAVFLGVCFAVFFAHLWPNFQGAAAWAIWPMGMATGMFGVTLGVSLLKHQMYWDLLIAGKIFALAGTILFFIASL